MTKTINQDIWKTLQTALPKDALVTDPVELIAYEIDGSLGLGEPHGVALPRSTDEVVTLMKWAYKNGVQVVARGAGTGLSGGAVANGGVMISFARMKQVLELDETGRSAVVQPGVVHLVFDEFVKTKDLYYPPDPASGRSCTIGGTLAENAGGPHCFKYGVTTNYTMGLEVVLADGRVIHTGGSAYDYPEYDLTGLLVGSEGTLGLMTSANVRLIRNIPGIKTLMAIFNSVEEAGEAVSAVIARGLTPATLEMMDRNMIGVVENYVHAGLPTDAEALLIIEADGYPESLDSQMDEIMAVMNERKARELRLAKSTAERDKIWYARKSAFGAIAQISPAYLILDGTVPRSKLGYALAEINKICASVNLRVCYVFHAGDGNLHPLILFDPSDPEMIERVHKAGHEVIELCVQMGGTITGEHGVGSEKRQYMSLIFNPGELQAQKDIKEVFDPKNILNPGKVLPEFKYEPKPVKAQPLTTTFRLIPPLEKGDKGGFDYAPVSVEEAEEGIRSWSADTKSQSLRLRGGGTKSSLLPPADVTLSTQNLRGIQSIAVNDLYVTVNAGTPLSELQQELKSSNVWVPMVSPWAESTVGGVVATNFNAPLRSRYGAIRDLILAMTVVLPDGRVIRAGKAVVKNVAGYDLPKLFVGSYGTLGLITDVTFKLLPFPRKRSTLVVPVDDLKLGLALGRKLLRVCLVASSLILCKDCKITGVSSPYAIIYTAEGLPEDVQTELAQARTLLQSEGVKGAKELDTESGNEMWADWMNMSSRAGTILRMGVAPKDLGKALTDLAPTLKTPFMADLPSGMVFMQSTEVEAVRQSAQANGGYTIMLSGANGKHDVWGHKPEGLDLMRGIKSRWDSRGLFNPGAFIV
jgi:D-lactate dehydrogenase (cytochrome)